MSKEPMFPLMKYIHTSLKNNASIPKTFILGNVSCDLDSFLSAYILSLAKAIKINRTHKLKHLYIPLVNCSRGDISNRFDIEYLLQKYHINPSSLLYVNDHYVQSNIKNSKVILVDHNKPDISQEYLIPLVTEIYDHHKDEHLFNSLKEKQRNHIITPLGSCSTLILDKFYLPKFPIGYIDPLMSLSSVLIDTENFNHNLYKRKWVDLDMNVYNKIMKQSFPNKSQVEYKKISDDYYNVLMNAKNNIKKNLGLGIRKLMDKDKKQYFWNKTKGGWSALQICLNDLLQNFAFDDLIKEVNQQCKDNGYQLYMVIYSDKINNNKSIKNLIAYNHSLPQIQFDLLIDHIQNGLGDKYYGKKVLIKSKAIQLNVHQSLSRKHCEPIIQTYFNLAKH